MSVASEQNPFVGLRPFESSESLLFFGRQTQILELLQRLHDHHFVGVIGSSGSGKSSLIRAGLIPRLKAGYLVDERDQWLLSIFKPGESPLYNFIFALFSELKQDNSKPAIDKFLNKVKEQGADAVIEVIKNHISDNRTNLFILVDQFEELFRFSVESEDAEKRNEAIDFVNILLQISGRKELPVYIVITMRSDFIGDCALFHGLPEALNTSQYLVPRLTRIELKSVIEGPVRLYGGKINPALTFKLINEVERVKDELPLLQHVLMRVWDYESKTDKNGELDLDDYEAVGSIEHALSLHADEAMIGMSETEKQHSATIFQALTTTDHSGRKIRRPAHLSELIKLTGSSAEAVNKIITHFNEDKRAFLVVSKGHQANDSLIDISHESLIRQWKTLNEWAESESKSAKTYLHICESALLFKEGKKDVLGGTELEVALEWRNARKPDAVWASRYNSDFNLCNEFLEKSIKQAEIDKAKQEESRQTALLAQHQKKLLRRTTQLLVIIGVFLLAAIYSTVQFYQQKNKALKALEINTRALDSLYVAKSQVQADCWDQFIPVERVLRGGNPDYVAMSEREKTNSANDPSGTNSDADASNGSKSSNASESDNANGSEVESPAVPPNSNAPASSVKPENQNNSEPNQAAEVSNPNIPQTVVDVKPEFPGGKSAMKDFIRNTIEFPDAALKQKISGTVNVRFVVLPDGKISNAEVVGSAIGYGLEAAALEVINKMPKWKPAIKNGKPVATFYGLPITFILPNGSE